MSNPDDVGYGKHLTVREIAAIVGSDREAISNVTTWLKSHGGSGISVSSTRDIVRVTLACGEAEKAFSTEIHRFRHTTRSQTTLLRATAPHSLPKDIAPLVALVGDLVGLPDPRGPLVVPPVETDVR